MAKTVSKRSVQQGDAELRPSETASSMTMDQRLQRMEEIRRQATSSPEAARAYLMATGMYTPSGKLKKVTQGGKSA